MTSEPEFGLRRSLPRLAFYAQGVFETFGLPVSLVLFTPNGAIPIIVECDLQKLMDKLASLSSLERALKLSKNIEAWKCASCGFNSQCPISKVK